MRSERRIRMRLLASRECQRKHSHHAVRSHPPQAGIPSHSGSFSLRVGARDAARGRASSGWKNRYKLTPAQLYREGAGRPLRMRHCIRIEHPVELLASHQSAITYEIVDSTPAFQRLLCNFRGLLVTKHRNQGGDDADRMLDEMAHPLRIGSDARDAPYAQNVAGTREDDHAAQQPKGNYGLEYVQLKLPGFSCHRNRDVSADDVEAHLVYDLGNHRIHLARHHG